MGGFSFRAILVCLLCLSCHKHYVLLLSAKVVESLPGFNGPLPFHLETGYVTVDEINGGELFYYFIKSEGKPSEDPVLLWLTGGHRCSALSGLIFEVGPFKLVKALYNGSIPEIEYHPYAWTKHANVIFLDSPLGAGFSFSSNPKGYEVGDMVASAQIQKFLKKWFTDHPEYVSHSFFVAGDSYAGKIVPVVAQLISQDNEAGQQPLINLKGYLVGNPSTGEKIDINSRVPYAHGVGIISDEIFEMTQKGCAGEDYSNPTKPLCAEMMNIVDNLKKEVSTAHILEPHCDLVSPSPKFEFQNRRYLRNDESVQLQSKPAAPAFFCREYSFYLSYFWANDNVTRDALGIKEGTVNEWQRCLDLPYERDIPSSIKYHLNLTTRGYRALVYSGDHDMVVPFLGTQKWIRSLNFPIVDGWRAWHVDGQTAGFTETFSNNLTFATVRGGGHTAPEYKPKECLAMFQRWISNQPL